MAIEILVEMIDIERILADHNRNEILDRTGYRPGLPLQRGFSPAKQARLVGNNLYKYPIPHLCVDDDGLNIGNFHRAFQENGRLRTGRISTTLKMTPFRGCVRTTFSKLNPGGTTESSPGRTRIS